MSNIRNVEESVQFAFDTSSSLYCPVITLKCSFSWEHLRREELFKEKYIKNKNTRKQTYCEHFGGCGYFIKGFISLNYIKGDTDGALFKKYLKLSVQTSVNFF